MNDLNESSKDALTWEDMKKPEVMERLRKRGFVDVLAAEKAIRDKAQLDDNAGTHKP